MVRRRSEPVEQAELREQEGPGADGHDEFGGGGLVVEPSEDRRVFEEGARAETTGND